MRLMSAKSSRVDLLRRVRLFDGLSDRQLRQISSLADEIGVRAGRRLARLGETGHEMFVIVEGEALVTTESGRRRRLGPGDFFGEMSLLDGQPRSATVESLTPMRLLVIGHREFWQLLNEAPALTRKIMQTLSRRLRDTERSPLA